MVECQRHGVGVEAAFLQREAAPVAARGHGEPQPERAPAIRRPGAVTQQEQGGVGIARELGEPHRDRAREDGAAVEDHQGEGPAPQQEIGAPRGTRRIGGTDHPHRL